VIVVSGECRRKNAGLARAVTEVITGSVRRLVEVSCAHRIRQILAISIGRRSIGSSSCPVARRFLPRHAWGRHHSRDLGQGYRLSVNPVAPCDLSKNS
jgi:hypothetical protein